LPKNLPLSVSRPELFPHKHIKVYVTQRVDFLLSGSVCMPKCLADYTVKTGIPIADQYRRVDTGWYKE
jgi:hypothetical protein